MQTSSSSNPPASWAAVSKKMVSAGTSSMLAMLPPVTRWPAASREKGEAPAMAVTSEITWSLKPPSEEETDAYSPVAPAPTAWRKKVGVGPQASTVVVTSTVTGTVVVMMSVVGMVVMMVVTMVVGIVVITVVRIVFSTVVEAWMIEVAVLVTVMVFVVVVVGAATVVVVGVTPMQEHAEEYWDVPEQAEA